MQCLKKLLMMKEMAVYLQIVTPRNVSCFLLLSRDIKCD
jgi:hypothetical protein